LYVTERDFWYQTDLLVIIMLSKSLYNSTLFRSYLSRTHLHSRTRKKAAENCWILLEQSCLFTYENL